jgi:hypothetical protein
MANLIFGKCNCGSVRFSGVPKSGWSISCGCDICKRQNQLHNSKLQGIVSESFTIKGEVKSYEHTNVHGSITTFSFCPECMTQLFRRNSVADDTVVVNAVNLENFAFSRPNYDKCIEAEENGSKLS